MPTLEEIAREKGITLVPLSETQTALPKFYQSETFIFISVLIISVLLCFCLGMFFSWLIFKCKNTFWKFSILFGIIFFILIIVSISLLIL